MSTRPTVRWVWCSPVVLLALLLAPTWNAVGQTTTVCDRFAPGTVAGALASPDLDELSGLAASRVHAGVFWGHDDSGGDAALFALSETGADLGQYDISGATNVDWEDMAAAGGYLYIGDIGDNDSQRDHVTVYRVPEPTIAPTGIGGGLDGTEAITLRYPGGPSDAESLIVDPLTGDLYILTKSFSSVAHVLTAPATALVDGADITMTDAGTVPNLLATGADVSPDGTIALVRTYGSVQAFARPAGGTLADAFGQPPCDAPSRSESQGEAIAFTAAGDAYITASEGPHQPIHHFRPSQSESTTSTSTTIDTDVDLAPVAEDESSDGPPGFAIALVLGCAVLVVAFVTRGLRRR